MFTKAMAKLQKVKKFDAFGFPIHLNYMGDGSYRTFLGTFCTFAVYSFMLVNIFKLGSAFQE